MNYAACCAVPLAHRGSLQNWHFYPRRPRTVIKQMKVVQNFLCILLKKLNGSIRNGRGRTSRASTPGPPGTTRSVVFSCDARPMQGLSLLRTYIVFISVSDVYCYPLTACDYMSCEFSSFRLYIFSCVCSWVVHHPKVAQICVSICSFSSMTLHKALNFLLAWSCILILWYSLLAF